MSKKNRNKKFSYEEIEDDGKLAGIKSKHYRICMSEFTCYNLKAKKMGLQVFDGMIPALCVNGVDTALQSYSLSALGEGSFFVAGSNNDVIFIMPKGETRPSLVIADRDADVFSVYKLAAAYFSLDDFKKVLTTNANEVWDNAADDDEEFFAEYRPRDGRNSKSFRKIFDSLGAGIFSCDVDDEGKFEMFVENHGKVYRIKPTTGDGCQVYLT